jgi:hypothetical protein
MMQSAPAVEYLVLSGTKPAKRESKSRIRSADNIGHQALAWFALYVLVDTQCYPPKGKF